MRDLGSFCVECFSPSARAVVNEAKKRSLEQWPFLGSSGKGYRIVPISEALARQLECFGFRISAAPGGMFSIRYGEAEIRAPQLLVEHRLGIARKKCESGNRLIGIGMQSFSPIILDLWLSGTDSIEAGEKQCTGKVDRLFKPESDSVIRFRTPLFFIGKGLLQTARERLSNYGLKPNDVLDQWMAVLTEDEFRHL